ncbi:hypothetical protein Bca4012_029088 [Brassica carinata]
MIEGGKAIDIFVRCFVDEKWIEIEVKSYLDGLLPQYILWFSSHTVAFSLPFGSHRKEPAETIQKDRRRCAFNFFHDDQQAPRFPFGEVEVLGEKYEEVTESSSSTASTVSGVLIKKYRGRQHNQYTDEEILEAQTHH